MAKGLQAGWERASWRDFSLGGDEGLLVGPDAEGDHERFEIGCDGAEGDRAVGL